MKMYRTKSKKQQEQYKMSATESMSTTASVSEEITLSSITLVLSNNELFETDMMNILKFLFRIYITKYDNEMDCNIVRNDYDIYSELFWKKIFWDECIATLNPPPGRYNIAMMPAFHIRGKLLITDIMVLVNQMDMNGYFYDIYISKDDNIGTYLYLKYHVLYMDKICQWAQEEYGFSPK